MSWLAGTKNLTNGDADAQVTRIALLILRIVELKTYNYMYNVNVASFHLNQYH